MSYVDDEFFIAIKNFYNENNWRDILNLNKHSDISRVNKILWVWPGEDELNFLKKVVLESGHEGISSIGCGSGLLEWIIKQSTGLPVDGYEINEEWWKSKYSCPQFINLIFPEFPLSENILKSEYALLFCYFNDGLAFEEYVQNYKGNLVIIMGPSYGRGRHTDPQPFEAKFPTSEWKIMSYKEVKQTNDFIACYVR